MKKTIVKTTLAAALGAVIASPVQAAVYTYNYDGFFTMLDPAGYALANNSISAKQANQFQTPISGTMSFDSATGAGTGTLVPFDFFSNDPTLPAEAVGMTMQAIGDGLGGPGTLVLGNMLFNWNGNNGIPVSIVLDAAGLFNGFFNGDSFIAGTGAVPASDGTYVGDTVSGTAAGYLSLGPVPMATTEWNTTNAPGCNAANGGCIGIIPSGFLPLLIDTTANVNKGSQGIGGSPMVEGPTVGFSPNFDITAMTFVSQDPNGSIGPFPVSAVPVPAAVWLFGSGVLSLVGVARRKKSNV